MLGEFEELENELVEREATDGEEKKSQQNKDAKLTKTQIRIGFVLPFHEDLVY